MKLSELKTIAERRTKGSWGPTHKDLPDICVWDEGGPASTISCYVQKRPDAEFIATMANHIDALLEVVEQAKYVFARGDKKYCEIQDLGDDLEKLESIK